MIRLPAFFLLLLITLLPVAQATAANIYVAVNGSDNNPGTKDEPLATVAAALRKARELRRLADSSIANGIHIIVSGGVYNLDQPIFIRPEDAGTLTSPTNIEAAPGAKPVLSGGFQISNWHRPGENIPGLPAVSQQNVWVADVPLTAGRFSEFRQLWVNGHKAVRAKNYNGQDMGRILSWNKKDETCVIPLAASTSLQHLERAEMFIHQWWAIAILRIRKIEMLGDSARLYFHHPESKIQSEHPWPAPWISASTGNSAFYLTNAISFLDEPGEWWLDVEGRKLYYWPLPGENMANAVVVAPAVETLVRVEGTADNPVTNIFFKGIAFEYAGWLRPSLYGHVPHQAGMYMLDAYRLKPAGTKEKQSLDNQAWIGRPAAAVYLSFAERTGFENCRFEHLASTGLDYHKNAHINFAVGNLFKDIGGTAILAGVYSDESTEIHLPYHPKDEREVCDDILIRNNLVTDAANEDWSCVGIGAGYTRNTVIDHNEVENVSYTGISMGWGWSAAENVMKNNRITANAIHHYGKHNYDCSGIYTLSAQPGSLISENYIDSIYKAPYAHLPSHWFYLYTDEGSSYITVKDNWTPSTKFLKNANGPGNVWDNNGPQVQQLVKQQAGMQPAYRSLALERTSASTHLAINTEHKEVIELVSPEGKQLELTKLRQFLFANKIDSNALYQWRNHYVIYDKVADMMSLEGKLRNNFPSMQVKGYYDMFYQFDKARDCADKSVAAEWDHIILTANLVSNPQLQQEYLQYHATQFEKWPEVAKGFCNAGFQQLSVFRNGRQLVLVISIPRGESLDRLNPLTTENNPRMDEWNRIMKKYQEGIEGARKAETWVVLQQVK